MSMVVLRILGEKGGGSKGGSYLCNLDVFGSVTLDLEIFLSHKIRYMVT